MKIEKKLETLLQYYLSTRNAGHTTLMREGTTHYDRPFFILVHHTEYGKNLNYGNIKDIISYQNLDKLIGHSRPLAIDNGVMAELLADALMRIEALKDEIEELKNRNQTILIKKK